MEPHEHDEEIYRFIIKRLPTNLIVDVMRLNDLKRFTFLEIADYIERNGLNCDLIGGNNGR